MIKPKNSIHNARLPDKITQLIARSFENLPQLAQVGMPLHRAPIDHVAIALPSKEEVATIVQALLDTGYPIAEPLHLWPDDIPDCPPVAAEDRKWMATIDIGEMLVVLLAPCSEDDLIARFLERAGRPDIHHIAFAVDPIDEMLNTVTMIPGVRQITPLAEDEDLLSQVFLMKDPDIRIVELIERPSSFRGTFTCRNIIALTQGERLNAVPG